MNEVNIIIEKQKVGSGVKVGGKFIVECFDELGNLKWEDTADNLVTTEGLQHILDVLFNSDDSAIVPVDPWYVGLTDASPTPAAGDTLASHAGWSEDASYSESNRQAYNGVRSSQTVSNTASKAVFTINVSSASIGGAFLASVNSGTSGTLLCVAAFTGGNKAVASGDTLNVTYQFTAADDGV